MHDNSRREGPERGGTWKIRTNVVRDNVADSGRAAYFSVGTSFKVNNPEPYEFEPTLRVATLNTAGAK